jgi:hypothetical protein
MREIEARVLADRGGVYSASVKAFDNGYTLRFETSKGLEALTLQRGGDRVFKTLDAVAALLRSLGVSTLSVDLGSVSVTSQVDIAVTCPGQVAVTPPPDERGRDVSWDARDERTGDSTPRDNTRSRELLLDAGMNPLEKAKADPKRSKARANRKKRR